MSAKVPPLHALRAFEAAARHGSFTKAADELCVTRSAVSHRIHLLESLLGMPLFQRKGQVLALTARGSAYLDSVKKALDSLQGIALPIATASAAGAWPVVVAAPPTFARMMLVPRLGEFLAAQPGIEMAIHVTAPLLDAGWEEADVEIRFGHGVYPGLESHPLLDEPVFPVCSPDHAARVALRKPDDLKQAILLRSSLEPWRPWFAAAGLSWEEPTTGPRFEDLALLYHAAAESQGIALARASLVKPLLESGALSKAFDISARSPHAYYMVYEPHSPERPEVASFIEWLRQSFA